MSLRRFIQDALSDWMKGNKGAAYSDIVFSSRIRLARNLKDIPFPLLATNEQAQQVQQELFNLVAQAQEQIGLLQTIKLDDLNPLERRVLVEKHLVSPNFAEESRNGGVLLSEDESVSIMINEEDHLRIQCLEPGLRIQEAWMKANIIDDALEAKLDYAFDEKRGYLTSCPTNVGTGLRASVMMHLPALVISNQMSRLLAAISQVGLVVRGIYGEGSEAMGNLFQVSNQVTLGQTEEEIVDNLDRVVKQIVEHERAARRKLVEESQLRLADRVNRSYGVLSYARVLDSKEAAQRLSDVRLGIDLGIIEDVDAHVMNELLVMTQPGFLQQYAGGKLSADERDQRRATVVRERLRLARQETNQEEC